MILKSFEEFNESRGINEWIKAYSVFIYENTLDVKSNQLQIDIISNDVNIIDLQIELIKSNKNHGLFNPSNSKIINNQLHFTKIIIEYKIYDRNTIIDILNHELIHLYEYYMINMKISNFLYYKSPKYLMLKNYQKSYNKNNEEFDKFVYLIYLSLDSEMNARVAEVYNYLLSFKETNYNYLFGKLQLHKNYKYYLMLSEFDHGEFISSNLDKIGLDELLSLSNNIIDYIKSDSNKKIFLINTNKKLKDLTDLKLFYKKWQNYFKNKSEKNIKKLRKMIYEVIIDVNNI